MPAGLKARAATVVVAAALTAVAGFSLGHSNEPGRSTATAWAGTATSSALSVRRPAGWRDLPHTPTLPGLALAKQLALGPAGASGERIVVGIADAPGPWLTPDSDLQLADPVPPPQAVLLGSQRALRYRGLRPRGSTTRLTLFALPSDRGVATVACVSPAGAPTASFSRACDQIAATLKLRGGRALDLLPSARYARSVRTIVAALDRARRRDGQRLSSASTAAGQARLSAGLKRAHERAASALADPRVSRYDRAATRAVVARLKRSAAAYTDLESAARGDSPSRFRAARRAVVRAERLLGSALGQLAAAGYAIVER